MYDKCRVGEIYQTNNYGQVEVLVVHGYDKIDIRFVETGTLRTVKADCLFRGQVRDPNGVSAKPKLVKNNFRFCVYLHKDQDSIVRYVGNGTSTRAYQMTGRSQKWVSIFKEHQPIVEIVSFNMTKESAQILELDLIQKYNRTIINKIRVDSRTKEMDFQKFSSEFKYNENCPSGLLRKNFYGEYLEHGFLANGYYSLSFNGVIYKAHRVVWLLCNHSIDSSLVIDHIDGNPLNNKISNLRQVNRSENSKNKLGEIPKSGFRHIRECNSNGKLCGYCIMWRKPGHDKPCSKTFWVTTYGGSPSSTLTAAYNFRESIIERGEIIARIKDGEMTLEQAISKLEERV